MTSRPYSDDPSLKLLLSCLLVISFAKEPKPLARERLKLNLMQLLDEFPQQSQFHSQVRILERVLSGNELTKPLLTDPERLRVLGLN